MVFRSKVDKFFSTFMLIAVIVIAAASFFPFFLEGGTELPVVIILTSTFLLTIGLILWCGFFVQYVFYQEYLLVKGGPFRSKIKYEDVTKVAPTSDIFTGYRILSSRDAIEIFYKTGALGSVKISPKNKSEFLVELKKRCPNVKIQVNENS